MAHELAHCLSPSLSGNKAEDFAGSLLFLKIPVEQTLQDSKWTSATKVNKVIEIANKQVISPITVLGQVNKYVKHMGFP